MLLSQKRGQITQFIIIGLLILILLVILFSSQKTVVEEQITQETKQVVEVNSPKSVKQFIESCMEDISKPALYMIGLQGGSIVVPEQSYDLEYTQVAYSTFDGLNLAPTKRSVQVAFQDYVRKTLPQCLQDFAAFKAQGMVIEDGEIKTEIVFADDKIMLVLHYPVNIQQKDKITTFENYKPLTYGIRLSHLLDITTTLTEKAIRDPDAIDMTYLSLLDVDVVTVTMSPTEIVYFLKDPQSRISEGVPYVFITVHKLKEELNEELKEETGETT